MFGLNILQGQDKAGKVQVAVEYYAPHWVVLIKNPGSKDWVSLRDIRKFIKVYDEFGDEISKRPAIRSFSNDQEARTWVQENLPSAEYQKRSTSEMRKFLSGVAPSTIQRQSDSFA